MACVECFTGAVKHNETATGTETTLHGIPCYVANPPSGVKPKGIIVIIADAFGYPFINNRLLADNYASKGSFTVLLPDITLGYAAPGYMLFSMDGLINGPWLWKPYQLFWTVVGIGPFAFRNRLSVSMPRVVGFLRGLREEGIGDVNGGGGKGLPVGVTGFCWGGQHVVRLAEGKEKGLVDVAFVAHPSATSVPGDYERTRLPFAVAVGSKDTWLAGEPLEKLRECFAGLKGVKTDIEVYEGAGHGFSVRADPGNEKQTQQAKDAEDYAVKWFADRFAEIN